MATEENRLILRAGVVASFVAAFIIFILSALWSHQTDITTLKANQIHVMATLVKVEMIPAELARITEQLRMMGQTQAYHKSVSEANLKMLKSEKR